MKFIKIFAGSIVVLVLVLVVVGMLLPSERRVERSMVIDAPPSELFALANDFREFNKWSPWAEIDPEGTSYEFTGPPAGVGSMMKWSSEHPDVGSGTQEITKSDRNKLVKTELRFDGFDSPSVATFAFETTAGGTRITWSFDAQFDSMLGRYMGLIIDGWVGDHYERGLINMKVLAES